ncbi:MAG: hypothetical protein DI603_08975 [Roseateles depolymerans]|uniref:STAS/SEC14 domain-containing protein n=1 Tax=Roseateles depolymerans TaxID=76731 RepID=A0A2W5FKQ3_9BURK|nr:MAG: hypothetical protein DI603_08975 [Roseateles depolymerans]
MDTSFSDYRHLLRTRGFGRVSVSVHGRVMLAVAEGPFDGELMMATRRAVRLAAKQLPRDGFFVSLVEFRHSLEMEPEALPRLAEAVHGYISQGVVSRSLVFVAGDDLPGVENLDAVMAIWRPTRPVLRAHNMAEGWRLLNQALVAAGYPAEPPVA